jgi:hypothetical protein
MKRTEVSAVVGSVDEATKEVAAEYSRYAQVVKEFGIKGE